MSGKHISSSIDDFLKEERIFEEAQVRAIREVVAWQLTEAMKEKRISKSHVAQLLKTSRSQVNGLPDAKNATGHCVDKTSTDDWNRLPDPIKTEE